MTSFHYSHHDTILGAHAGNSITTTEPAFLRQHMTSQRPTHHRFIDLYAEEETSSRPLIVFIHGGAWRSESKEMFRAFAGCVLEEFHLPVAVLDYRLSTKSNNLKHPGHAEDVLSGLEELVKWPDLVFDRTRLYLVGHSAGGHILCSIFLDSGVNELEPGEELMKAVQGIVLASGIADPEGLLARFPHYDFIPQVFTEPYSRWNTLVCPLRRGLSENTRWHIVHSSGDVLVNIEQSETMFTHLVEAYARQNWNTGLISKDYDTLSVGHYYTSQAPVQFGSVVGAWAVQAIEPKSQ